MAPLARIAMLGALAAVLTSAMACERHEGPAERVGEEVDEAVDEAEDAAD